MCRTMSLFLYIWFSLAVRSLGSQSFSFIIPARARVRLPKPIIRRKSCCFFFFFCGLRAFGSCLALWRLWNVYIYIYITYLEQTTGGAIDNVSGKAIVPLKSKCNKPYSAAVQQLMCPTDTHPSSMLMFHYLPQSKGFQNSLGGGAQRSLYIA